MAGAGVGASEMIGETLYLRDENRRKYIQRDGRTVIDTANYFVPVVITGETKQSWLAQYQGRDIRISKKEHKIGGIREFYGMSNYAYTEQQMNEWLWFRENHARIVRDVQNCFDLDTLKAIDVLLQAHRNGHKRRCGER